MTNDQMTKCDRCSSPAVTFQRYSGVSLCKDHFDLDLHRKVRESLRTARALGHNAKVAAALDGGPESAAMLHALKVIFSRRSDLEFTALTVDEGIEGYSQAALEKARLLASRLNVPFRVVRFQEAFGLTLDEISTRGVSICESCRVLKRHLLCKTSREAGADLLVTGEGLDSMARAVMLGYIRGDMEDLQRLRTGLRWWSRPLQRVPADEIVLYAEIHDLPFSLIPCPQADDEMGLELGRALDGFEADHPGTKYSLLRGLESLVDLLPECGISACPRCGLPHGRGGCKSCDIMDRSISGAKPLSEDDI